MTLLFDILQKGSILIMYKGNQLRQREIRDYDTSDSVKIFYLLAYNLFTVVVGQKWKMVVYHYPQNEAHVRVAQQCSVHS